MKLKQIKLTKKNYTRTVRVTRNHIGYLKTADKFEFKSRDLVQGSKQLIKVHNSSKNPNLLQNSQVNSDDLWRESVSFPWQFRVFQYFISFEFGIIAPGPLTSLGLWPAGEPLLSKLNRIMRVVV